MPAQSKYGDELRERAIRMVRERVAEHTGSSHKRACYVVGEQLGIPGATLRNWFRDRTVASHGPSTTATTAADPTSRIAELERDSRELRRANAILKSASARARSSFQRMNNTPAYGCL